MEIHKSINDESMPKCCDAEMTQIYYAPGTQFKGTGWGGSK
jgi:predicted nucleic acid-binding Zn ribbon protein